MTPVSFWWVMMAIVFQAPCTGAEEIIQWTAGFANSAARATTLAAGTQLKFDWQNTHNVHRMANLEAFQACDFTGATNLGSTSPVNFLIPTTQTETLYFACQVSGHCQAGQKLAVTVMADPSSTTAEPSSAPSAGSTTTPSAGSTTTPGPSPSTAQPSFNSSSGMCVRHAPCDCTGTFTLPASIASSIVRVVLLNGNGKLQTHFSIMAAQLWLRMVMT